MKIFIAIAALAVGCAAVKPVLRTINDAAQILCENAFGVSEQAEKEGLSVRDWCSIHEHAKPFIDEALKAQRAGAERAGLPSPTSSSDAGTP